MKTETEKAFEKWWEDYKSAFPPKGSASFYYTDNKEYAYTGFLAGRKSIEKENKELREALDEMTSNVTGMFKYKVGVGYALDAQAKEIRTRFNLDKEGR